MILMHPRQMLVVDIGVNFASIYPDATTKIVIFVFKKVLPVVKKQYFGIRKKNGVVKPRDLALASNKKYWFKCGECGHDLSTSPSRINNNEWCGVCKNKTEKKLLDFLAAQFDDLVYQFRPEWCKNIQTDKYLPFDFCVPSRKIIIELDGRHHFEDVKQWHSLVEKTQDRDKYKMAIARTHNYSIIRVCQMDVWEDAYDWQTDLLRAIKLCGNSKIMFCSKNRELYSPYK